ncbi:bifunctional diguanylate cyclase/phosphodiesterase [Inmirania thermothiophila]|uniref:cyclic-guanylate-specific phosphodiesterase n=1 Tax=Inmirania thermothiophila TaxID=1750597 RepID=A0A3N1Y7L6_9GAMM|nr:EAL domain-containing protein [Inmirania thermothiophila]ROR34508.1 PAS domain S-box-containing protein/diguanylate cyclase (GGDEF)-like protein [Inmirania thermothiophila]
MREATSKAPDETRLGFLLTRRFALFALAAALAVGAGLAALYRFYVVEALVLQERRHAESLARSLVSVLHHHYDGLLDASAAMTAVELARHPLQEDLRELLEAAGGGRVVRAKLYDGQGRTVFSTRPYEVGEDQARNPGVRSALGGQVHWAIERRGHFNVHDRVVEQQDLLETYVPVAERDDGGRVHGVVELYTDIGPLFAQVRRVQWALAAGTALALLLLWAGITWYVRRGALALAARLVRRETRLAEAEARIAGLEADLAAAREEARRAEGERRRALRELEYARIAFEKTSEGIVVTDRTGAILAVNPAFTRLTGYAPEEVIGENTRILSSGRHEPAFYEAMWRELAEQGQWQGEIWNRRKSGEFYPEWLNITAVREADGEITGYIGIFSDLSRVKAAEEQAAYLAQHDPLTGLPNRALLRDRIQQALAHARRAGERLALLFVDLDRFKDINDTLGHAAGDLVLKAVARRFARCIRADDTLARHAGDTFAVLARGIDQADDAARLAQCLLDALAEPVTVEGRQLFLRASIGIAVAPEDAEDPDSLLQHADAAMYEAASAGGGRYHFFAIALEEQARRRLDLEGALRKALERGELLLHYQPQVDLSDGAIVGAEALVRWRHPERGLIPPGEFIPVAEESGLVVPLGEWVLREACRQAYRWRVEGLPPVRVAVNLSARQFAAGDLAELVERILDETGMEPHYLELELTESALMADTDRAARTLGALRELGVHVAVDDFGTGYSSMAYLRRFPLSALKIDQAFVRGLPGSEEDAAIVGATAALARALGLRTVAEGVATKAQWLKLLQLRVDEIQGELTGWSGPPEELARRLREGRILQA